MKQIQQAHFVQTATQHHQYAVHFDQFLKAEETSYQTQKQSSELIDLDDGQTRFEFLSMLQLDSTLTHLLELAKDKERCAELTKQD